MPDRSFTGSHPGSPATRPMETGGDSPPSHGGVDERTGTRRESSPEAPMAPPILAASVGSRNSWRSSARIRYIATWRRLYKLISEMLLMATRYVSNIDAYQGCRRLSNFTIYVELLEEGSRALRPVLAKKIADRVFMIVGVDGGYDPEDEVWEFPLGSTVYVEDYESNEGKILRATRLETPSLPE